MNARSRSGRTTSLDISDSSPEGGELEQVVAYCRSSASASIPEEILGSVREPLTDSHRCGQSTSSSGKNDLRSRTRPTAAAVEQDRSQVAAGRLLFTQYTMADTADIHPIDGRRRREKGPPSRLALPRLERVSDTERGHSEDSAGEKEAKRQRSNPGTPVSTPRRMPYDYDAVMGITRVGTREAEGFDEDLDSTEYHDANDTTEETTRKEETEADASMQKSTGFQGGYGSSSLKECIELLNTTTKTAPAPLDSGVGKSADPQQICPKFVPARGDGILSEVCQNPILTNFRQIPVPLTATPNINQKVGRNGELCSLRFNQIAVKNLLQCPLVGMRRLSCDFGVAN